MSETATETKTTLKQLMEVLSPKKKTSKQEKAGDEVEDKRKKAATAETVTINKTSPSLDDETPEPTGQTQLNKETPNSLSHTEK